MPPHVPSRSPLLAAPLLTALLLALAACDERREVAPTPHLTNRHTIFGEGVQGQDVVERIARVPRDGADRPQQPVVTEKVTIGAEKP